MKGNVRVTGRDSHGRRHGWVDDFLRALALSRSNTRTPPCTPEPSRLRKLPLPLQGGRHRSLGRFDSRWAVERTHMTPPHPLPLRSRQGAGSGLAPALARASRQSTVVRRIARSHRPSRPCNSAPGRQGTYDMYYTHQASAQRVGGQCRDSPIRAPASVALAPHLRRRAISTDQWPGPRPATLGAKNKQSPSCRRLHPSKCPAETHMYSTHPHTTISAQSPAMSETVPQTQVELNTCRALRQFSQIALLPQPCRIRVGDYTVGRARDTAVLRSFEDGGRCPSSGCGSDRYALGTHLPAVTFVTPHRVHTGALRTRNGTCKVGCSESGYICTRKVG